ncbi:MAG: glycosyltransferase family 2 protein [Fibrobacter sp.]|nr:glycosyltransferase family 2 protein [Fibrobacter sp.]
MSLPARTVLVNYRNMDKTIACIRALDKMSVKPECVYLIDNATSQESRDLFEKAFPQSRTESFEIACIWNEANVGFAAACNQGIRAAREDYFDGYMWLLNNDTEPEPDSLKELLATAESSHAGITGSQIVSPDGKFLGGVGFVDSRFATVRRATSPDERWFNYIEGSSFLISPECLRKTGELSEEYFLYFEESDYCYKARQMGFDIAWATKSIVHHDIGSSTGSEQGKGKVPPFIDCLMIRNRYHFAQKFQFPSFTVKYGLFLSIMLRVFRLQPLRALAILRIVLSEDSFKSFIEKNGGFYAYTGFNADGWYYG